MCELDVPLLGGDNDIRIEVFNGTSMGVAGTSVVRSGTAAPPPPDDLYLLSIGASRFAGVPGADLDDAALDAEAIARFSSPARGGPSPASTRKRSPTTPPSSPPARPSCRRRISSAGPGGAGMDDSPLPATVSARRVRGWRFRAGWGGTILWLGFCA